MKLLTSLKLLLPLALAITLGPGSSIAAPKDKADLIPIIKSFKNGQVAVTNIGKAKSRASWLTIKCLAKQCPEHEGMNSYKNPKFPDAISIKIPALKASASYNHKLAFWNKLSFKPGQYKFLIFADAGMDIPESDETNNKAYTIKTVSKPINSFTPKTKPTKPVRKAINTHAFNKMPTVNSLANGPAKADLTIKPFYQNNTAPEGYPGQRYCERSITGGTAKNILFYVKNIGNAMAVPSTLKVFFNTFQVGGGQMSQYNKQLPSIAKGQSKIIKVSLPQDCYPRNYNSSCHFRIFVDTDYQVNENNEGNNYIDSKCVSPAD